MSNPLPAEMLDHIISYLYDAQDTLRTCCLVSKSWVPRARQHLFAVVCFSTPKTLQLWKEMFPDLSTSPACYTKTLSIDGAEVVTAVDAEVGSWTRGFSRIVRLEVERCALYPGGSRFSLVPFHGISPVIKSLRVVVSTLPFSHIFDLILSFPLLDDLAVMVYQTPGKSDDDSEEGEIPTVAQPSSSPMFTGSLKMDLSRGMRTFTHRLLSLPGGTHFRNLALRWNHGDDPSSTMSLVDGCSHTLESLDITCNPLSTLRLRPFDSLFLFLGESPTPAPIDLSKVTKLKDVIFRPNSWGAGWVVGTFQTIIPKHRDLRQITIHIPYYMVRAGLFGDIRQAINETQYGQWMDIDRLLVQFWESRSIRPKVICTTKQGMGDNLGRLLPEITGRGIIDLVE
jgi:hypothetical protein